MDKAYAYVGVAAAVVVLAICFYPLASTPRYWVKATSFDKDLVSAMARRASTAPQLMELAYDFSSRCRKVDEDGAGTWCELRYVAPDLGYIYDHKDALSQYVPNIGVRLGEFLKQDDTYSPILTSLQQDLVAKYPEMVERNRSNYVLATYAGHVLLLILAGIMVWYRRPLGQAIGIGVTGPLKAAGKVLAGVHKRV